MRLHSWLGGILRECNEKGIGLSEDEKDDDADRKMLSHRAEMGICLFFLQRRKRSKFYDQSYQQSLEGAI